MSKTFLLFLFIGEFKVANEFSLLGDKVGEVAVQRRSTQSRLEQGNVIADAINS